MDAHQEQFLTDEFFSLTLAATVGRANVYTVGSSERERKVFQSALRSQLEQIAQGYESKVSSETHIQNVLGLSKYLTEACEKTLRGGRFRIGTAQKALNLYLKYLWCIEKIPTPPHCPFDFQIIAKLPAYSGPSWTALDSEQEYRALVTVAEEKAQGLSLAVWELRTYKEVKPAAAAGKNTKDGKHGAIGSRTGEAMGAKPIVRALLGTPNDAGEYPSYTVNELCAITKKSDVNIRTVLSDLRSQKYCGSGGVFMTHSFKKEGKTYYKFGTAPGPQAQNQEDAKASAH
jgi:hypothetical protein